MLRMSAASLRGAAAAPAVSVSVADEGATSTPEIYTEAAEFQCAPDIFRVDPTGQ